MLSDHTLAAPSSYPLLASVYLEKNDPERHAGMWLRWIYASWSRQQLDVAFWDYIESICGDEIAFQKMAGETKRCIGKCPSAFSGRHSFF